MQARRSPKLGRGVREERGEPVRGLVEDHRPGLAGKGRERLASPHRTVREEALEGEMVGGQAGDHQGGHQGRRTGDHLHGNPLRDGVPHQVVSRVRDGGSAGVGDERHALPFAEAPQDPRPRPRLVVLVEDDHRRADLVAVQQLHRPPRVLAGDHRRLLEDAHGAEGDVLQVPQRRRHDVQRPAKSHAQGPSATGHYSFRLSITRFVFPSTGSRVFFSTSFTSTDIPSSCVSRFRIVSTISFWRRI